MATSNRAFFPQEAVDNWLASDRISLEGEVLALLPDGPAFKLEGAVLFRSEVSTGEDTLDLCGKVKTLAAVAELAGEHAPGSVVVGDHAYEVLDGFVGVLVKEAAVTGAVTGNRKPARGDAGRSAGTVESLPVRMKAVITALQKLNAAGRAG